MKTGCFAAVVAVLVSALSVPAFAEVPNYFAVRAGLYSPQSDDMEDFDEGFAGELALGHYFTRNLAGEFAVGYFRSDRKGASLPFPGDVELSSVPVTVSVKAVAPVDPVELYAGAGIGAYFNEAELTVPGFSDSSTDTSFGFHVVGGATADLTQSVFCGIELKYLWTEASFDVAGFGAVDNELDGFTATAGLGLRF